MKRWLDAKFLKRLSKNVFQVSVGGRMYSAHRDQLKLKPKAHRTLVCGWQPNRKRRREDDADFDEDSDSSDYYGYLADSFINDPHQHSMVEVGNSLSVPSTSGNSLSKKIPDSSLSTSKMALSGRSVLPSSGDQMPMSASSCHQKSARQDDAFEVLSNDQGLLGAGLSVPSGQDADNQKVADSRNDTLPRRSRRLKRQKIHMHYKYY